MTVAIDHIECLGCGQFRPPPSEQAECPFCAYVGWAPSSALTEGERAWYAALRLASATRWQLQRAAI
jgi:hypothetical protein